MNISMDISSLFANDCTITARANPQVHPTKTHHIHVPSPRSYLDLAAFTLRSVETACFPQLECSAPCTPHGQPGGQGELGDAGSLPLMPEAKRKWVWSSPPPNPSGQEPHQLPAPQQDWQVSGYQHWPCWVVSASKSDER